MILNACVFAFSVGLIINTVQSTSMQEVIDDRDRRWSLLLKQWTSHSGNTPRPIFVLERTAECMLANRGAAGFYLQLWTANGHELRISILSPPEFQADSAAASDWRQPSSNVNFRKNLPEGLVHSRNTFTQSSFKHRGLPEARAHHPYYGNSGRMSAFVSSYIAPREVEVLQSSDRNAPCKSFSIAHGIGHAQPDNIVAQPCPSVHGIPEWVRVRCGHAIGDLHVPSMQVTTVNLRTNTCLALSLTDFESSGGQGLSGQWQTSVIVEDCGLPLGRWLSLWEHQKAQTSAQICPQEQAGVHAHAHARAHYLNNMHGPDNQCQQACHGYAQACGVQDMNKHTKMPREPASPVTSESNEGVSSRITHAKTSMDPATATATEVLLSFCQGAGSMGNAPIGGRLEVTGAYSECVASENHEGYEGPMRVQNTTEVRLPAEHEFSCRPQASYVTPASAYQLYENITKEVIKRKQFLKEEEERHLQDLARRAIAMKVLTALV